MAAAATQASSMPGPPTSSRAHRRGSAATGCWCSMTPRRTSPPRASLHVLRRLALRPRVVLRSKTHPLADRWVRVQPELDERTGGRIRQPDLTHNLERLRRRLLRVRHDAVDHLEPVNIGIVFLSADQRVRNRGRKEIKNRHREK